jgi:hypothetical protein
MEKMWKRMEERQIKRRKKGRKSKTRHSFCNFAELILYLEDFYKDLLTSTDRLTLTKRRKEKMKENKEKRKEKRKKQKT